MRTREEIEKMAGAMDSEKLLNNFQDAVEKVMYAVNAPDHLAMNHTVEEWGVVVEVARAEILRRMGE